jgi:hypothetical protein
MVYAFVHKFIIIAFIMSCIFNMPEVTVARLSECEVYHHGYGCKSWRQTSVIYTYSFQILFLMYI